MRSILVCARLDDILICANIVLSMLGVLGVLGGDSDKLLPSLSDDDVVNIEEEEEEGVKEEEVVETERTLENEELLSFE